MKPFASIPILLLRRLIQLAGNIGLLLSVGVPLRSAEAGAPGAKLPFVRLQLHDRFVAEGSAIGDFNKDGKPDVVAGPEWFEGPDFKVANTFRPVSKAGQRKFSEEKRAYDVESYSDNFLTFTYDFNADGWDDILVVDWPGEGAYWFENPAGKAATQWARHDAFAVVNNESPNFADITGDGRPELIAGTTNKIGYMEFDPKNPAALWTFHAITSAGRYSRYTHGLGIGDVNSDGRMDLLEVNGWWEQPARLTDDSPWKFHAQTFGGTGGAQMHVYDVNGDGKNDVITSRVAHGYGLSWYEQVAGATGGESTWIEHAILGATADEKINGVQFSQPHAVLLEDLDGDGLKDIITGKRYLAHGTTGDADPLGTPVIYWFKLTRDAVKGVSYTPYLIDDHSGVGTQFSIGDLNGDGRPDVASVNKKGATLLLQQK